MAGNPEVNSQIVNYYRYYPTLILGRGNFATVYLARHRIVKCDVALKIINIDDIKEDYVRRNLHREEKIMRILHHPNIIQLYEVVEEGNLHCLSLELVQGVNLYQYMTKKPNHSIPERLARYFFYQMLSAVEYMHNLNVIHRDLKLENILVEYGHIIKIADFGLSNMYYPCIELRTHCGSIEYAAPELFHSSAYGTAADVWSLGVVLYVMVVGKMPFVFCQKKEDYALNIRMRRLFMQRISKGLMQDNWEMMDNLSQDCWNLLHEFLEPDQFKRIRIQDAITHPWIIKDKCLMNRLPQKRKDLQRKFHPEVIEYLACKLNTTKDRIETHIHVYQNDKVAAMYFMVRNVLIKEVLHPLQAFENSFLYRFECWRENLKLQRSIQNNACTNKYFHEKEKKESTINDNNYKLSSQSYDRRITNLKSQPFSEINAGVSKKPPIKYSVKKVRQCASEDVDSEEKDVQDQEKNFPRNAYRSYRKSRPANVFYKGNHQDIVTNNKSEIKETPSNLAWSQEKPNSIMEEEFVNNRQKLYENSPRGESDDEKKGSIRCYREYSSRVRTEERNKMCTTYTNMKNLMNETGDGTRKMIYSINETSTVKTPNSSTKKIEILKRTEVNSGTPKPIFKTENENNVGLQSPTQKSICELKKIEEVSKGVYAQTPSRIPVKIMGHSLPAPFSQPPVSSTKKAAKFLRRNGISFCRGDTGEDVK